MKAKILSFILGGFTFLCIGAGADILTVKPAVPKSTAVIECNWARISENKAQILKYANKGYIVTKTVSVDTKALVVMEKY